ncbi:MAG: hypothetical protein ACRDF7_04885 [Candidatus Limnocylindrales bacterium]
MATLVPTNRRARFAFAALLVLMSPLSIAAAPSGASEALAANGSQASGATTYTIDPAQRLVHAHVVLNVKNTKPNLVTGSSTIRYYFQSWSIGVQDEARHVQASRSGRAAAVRVQQKSGYKLVDVTISPAIFFGSTASLLIDFDLPDGGARSTSQVRVGAAFATFVAYAFGDDQATVRVNVPAGYEVTTSGDPILSHADASGTLLTTDGSVDDVTWYAVITADRPAGLHVQTLSLSIDGQDRLVDVRGWPEDATWSATVARELTSGLPELGRLIGLAWPVKGPLEVQEAYTPLLGGYAGFYIQNGAGALDLIRVTEEPDAFVVLHEASHAWFNAGLLDGRWINEGLADQYASLAQVGAGGVPSAPAKVDRHALVAFPLNDWPPPGRIVDTRADEREQYGYAVSWTIVRALFDELGAQGMRSVLAPAAAHEIAYVGRPPAESQTHLGGPTDWRFFLDLLEQRGDSAQAAGLFATWVVTDAERASLARHEELREAYAALVARGTGWLPGFAVRGELAAWHLDGAQSQLDEAGRVLDLRGQIVSRESALGVADGGVLEHAYEGAVTSYDDSLAVAGDELATLEALQSADTGLKAQRGLLTEIGLWGADPAAELAAAEDAYRAGYGAQARRHATLVDALMAGAEGVGTVRVAAGAGGTGLVVVSGVGIAWLRRRRRAVHAAALAEHDAAPATLAAPTADAGADAAEE